MTLVFIDTEFTDFLHRDLISIGLVSENGSEFYAERNDYRKDDCTDFVETSVLPLLGRVDGAICTRQELTMRLRTWFTELPEPCTVVFDYFVDWELLVDALLGKDFKTAPHNIAGKLPLTPEMIDHPIFQDALNRTFTKDWPPHHALADARATKAAYQAFTTAVHCI